jgi:DNA-3-methyladenine glycosylase
VSALADALSAPALEVAPRLLGAHLTANGVTVRLTEVEAYEGADDPASHAFRGRTPRNDVMFGPAGALYVYFTYGMHYCANVVCGPEGRASAVLLRAGEVVDGLEEARARRGFRPDHDLARGPAKLCQALGLTLADNGAVLDGDEVALELPERSIAGEAMARGPRVGIREAADRPWRFWVAGERTVSVYRPAKAPRPQNRL